jgi:hypothetical protein
MDAFMDERRGDELFKLIVGGARRCGDTPPIHVVMRLRPGMFLKKTVGKWFALVGRCGLVLVKIYVTQLVKTLRFKFKLGIQVERASLHQRDYFMFGPTLLWHVPDS